MCRHVASQARGNRFCWRIGQSGAPQNPSRRRGVSCEGWKTLSDRLPLGGRGDVGEGKPTVTTQSTWFVTPQYSEQTTPQGFVHSCQRSFPRKRKSELALWLWERLAPKEEQPSLFFSIKSQEVCAFNKTETTLRLLNVSGAESSFVGGYWRREGGCMCCYFVCVLCWKVGTVQ